MDDLLEREISAQLKQINILLRVNNVLLSKFIVQLQTTKKLLGLPKLEPFFKFELLEEDYLDLVREFGKKDTDVALYRLDKQMVANKVQCPHNIKKYIKEKLKKLNLGRARREYGKQKKQDKQDIS